MVDATQGPIRYLRATVVGLCVGLISVLGHTIGHGQLSPMAGLQVLCLALAGAGALTARRLRPWSLAAFVIGFQLAAHWLLGKMAPHPVPGPSLAPGSAGSHASDGLAAPLHLTAPLHLSGAQLPLPSPAGVDWPMLAGHLLAAVIIVTLLWRADDALFSLAAAVRRAAVVLLGSALRGWPFVVVARRSPVLPPATAPPGRNRYLCWLASWRYRGPPTPRLSRG